MRFTALALFLFFAVARTATGAPIDELIVSPLPGTPSCYAGTSGADNSMFWREDQTGILDCDIFGGGSPCLNRQESGLGDPTSGRAVSLLAGPYQRPSVSGAGDAVVFTEYGFNICFMATASEDNEGCFGRDFLGIDPHTGAYHPDGQRVAITRLDPDNSFNPTNDIFIVNPNTFQLFEVYEVIPSNFALFLIDTVDFTVDNDYLIIDAFDAVTGLKAIYAVARDIANGGASPATPIPVVAPVPGLVIGNPQLAQTSDDHMVFDAYDLATQTNYVMAADLRTGAVQTVTSFVSLAGSVPSYTGDDSAIIFAAPAAGTQTQASLLRIPIAADRITPTGVATAWIQDAYAPAIYRRGPWDGTLLPLATCAPVLPDSDADGVPDAEDNCSAIANPNQIDADGDAIGNACDADFNDDCVVNTLDLGFFKSVFFSANAEADLNTDGIVNPIDLGVLKSLFFRPPGPSGLPNLCD